MRHRAGSALAPTRPHSPAAMRVVDLKTARCGAVVVERLHDPRHSAACRRALIADVSASLGREQFDESGREPEQGAGAEGA
jgi:hypothetical protein